MSLNSELFFQIYNLSGHNYFIDKLMVFGADYLIWIAFILVFFLGIFRKGAERKGLILSIIGVVIATILTYIIRLFIFEPRPFSSLPIIPLINEQPVASFPSIHSTIIAVAAFAFLFAKSKFAPIFIICALWIAFARIYVGVHYPLDILGGFLLGLISVVLAISFIKFFRKNF